jgi:UDP-GlcNAc:undecaprenyl-phosphate/decaprenyl-phosphate GlcNAc-1-phosphate transferase
MHNLISFVLAMVVTMTTLPLLARLATKWLIVDQPDARKVHVSPIPRIGGLAMAIGVVIAAVISIDLQAQDRWFLVAAAILVVFGVLDDRFDLDYRIKLVGQVLAVGIVVFLGDVQVHAVTFDDRVALPDVISLPLTIFFLVGITNAINLADGLDGLAGGTTFLCLCAVALLSSVSDQGAGTAMGLTFAGAVLGFLRFNTYPASVFMGDAGSQLLGFTVGVLSVRATQSLASQVSAAIPILLLAMPILDTLSVMAQRISEGRSPFSPDKNHLHHKLLALGFGHHEAVMVIYAIQATLFVLAYFLRYESDLTILAVVSIFFAVAILFMQFAGRLHWQLRGVGTRPVNSALSQFVTAMQRPNALPRASYVAITAALAVYAGAVVLDTAALSRDIRVLIIALLAVTASLLVVLRASPLSLAERAALYVTATLLVYLDAAVLPASRIMTILTWGAISIAALATAIRLRLRNDRRFQLTPLDLIVLFMALVVPNLPGTFNLPHGGALTIAKLLILFYAIEVLVSRSEGRAVWVRVAVVSVLAGLAVRPLMPL